MTDKKNIHQRVYDVLGMSVPTEEEIEEHIVEEPLVPLPKQKDIVTVSNVDLPPMQMELKRLEQAQLQIEYMLDHAMPTVIQSLAEIALMPPIYKARSVEANAKLLDVVREMLQHKTELQIKVMDMRLKMASFTRSGKPLPTGDFTGNTFVFNREELMKNYPVVKANGSNKDEDN